MNFAFIDEGESDGEFGKYTSVTSAVFPADKIVHFQKKLIPKVREIFHPGEMNKNVYHQIPVLHANDLPSELDDNSKIELFRTVVNSAAAHRVKFFRVGYYNKPLQKMSKLHCDRHRRIDFCLGNLMFPLQTFSESGIVYVFELDTSGVSRMTNYHSALLNEFSFGLGTETNNSYENIDQMLGRFYCGKNNYNMYVADFASYLLGIRQRSTNSCFQSRLILECGNLFEHVLCDQIVYLNEPQKSYGDA